MIQKNVVKLNTVRKIVAEYVQTVKDPNTKSSDSGMLALMSFSLIAEEIYGKQFRKEMQDIIGEKIENEKNTASKLIRP